MRSEIQTTRLAKNWEAHHRLRRMNIMRNFDLAPLYRHSVGFDRMAKTLDSMLQYEQSGSGYPPFNIEKTGDNNYRITLAVAGFTSEEIDIESKESSLVITGAKVESDNEPEYLHRGIAQRAFERKFQLADYVSVKNASLENGLLHIDLEREVPEALKPRKIEIGKSKAKKIAKN